MLELKATNEQFSIPMEILSMIPCYPASVPMREVAKDLGVKCAVVQDIVSKVLNMDYGVRVFNSGSGRELTIDRMNYPRASRDAVRYLEAVYGDRAC